MKNKKGRKINSVISPPTYSSNDSASRIIIFIDGACSGNPGPGAWAAILSWNGHERIISGFEGATTNNRMELTAAIRALEAIKRPVAAEVWSDSTYLIKGITQWIHGWRKRNWKRTTGELENYELWRRLDELNRKHRITWRWVAGHAGHPGNERAHKLAADTLKGNLGTIVA